MCKYYSLIYIVFSLAKNVYAFNPVYISNPDTLPYTNWMSYFSDFLIADLPVVPGSHDSAAAEVSPQEGWLGIVGWLYAQTQNINLYNQLKLGIRLLDLRLTVTYDAFDQTNSINISHTFVSNTSLPEALVQVRQFLSEYPSEFVYLILRVDAARPLQLEIEAKQRYIESILRASELSFATVDAESLASVTVGQVAGKVVIITPFNDTLHPNTTMMYIPYDTNFALCDMWKFTSETVAKKRMAECFPQVPLGSKESLTLTGYALDGQFNQLWPNITSPALNDWWFVNFQQNSVWKPRKKFPIGIFLFDFVNSTYTSTLLDFAMNFGYPYPNNNFHPPWQPGMKIYVSGSLSTTACTTLVLAFLFIPHLI